MSAPAELMTLVDSSAHLRNAHQRLSLVQAPAAPLPLNNPVPGMVDDRLGFTLTKARKSKLPPWTLDRRGSELYPIARPPMHQFYVGTNTRLLGRAPVVM